MGQLVSPVEPKGFLTLAILEHTIKSSIFAVCWIIDEILYGRQLNKINLDTSDDSGIDMVFVVSAYRSASTHLARSLVQEQTDSLSMVSPNSMMMSVPYLWVWKLVSWFVGEMPETKQQETSTANGEPPMHPTLSKSEVRKWSQEKYSKECLERHDFDPFLVDTLDLSFLSCHLNGLVWEYCFATQSPDVVRKEFHYAKHTPPNKRLYEVDFCNHIDRLARKTVLFQQPYAKENEKTVVLFKGHFLSIVPALQTKYPNAKFITVLRDPCDRLKSAINYTAVNPSLASSMDRSNPEHWKLLANTLEETEAEYCLQEVETFGTANEHFLSIHFDAIATTSKQADTIASIHQWFLGQGNNKASATVSNGRKASSSKKTKKTKRYMVDKTLSELAIDETAYKNRLDDYIAYMNSVGTKKKII